jgi:hypothetical protein
MPQESLPSLVKGYIVELTEGSEIVETIFAGGANPSDWARNDETFKGVVREARFLAFCGFVEDVCAGHCVFRISKLLIEDWEYDNETVECLR